MKTLHDDVRGSGTAPRPAFARARTRAFITAIALAASALVGCGQSLPPQAAVHGPTSEWISTARPDLRALTVVVRADPPAAIRDGLLRIARVASEAGSDGTSYESAAGGAYGSGFFVVRGGSGQEPGALFVVTNHHVIKWAEHPRVVMGNGQTFEAEVVHDDPDEDLAVLAFPDAVPSITAGLSLDAPLARDRQLVIATGYPGLSGKPSFQTTEGKVSNRMFELGEGNVRRTFIQHTAPIDPGSSGGPLTTDDGYVLGVNTLRVLGRDNVYLAIPAHSVRRAVRSAIAIRSARASLVERQRALRLACEWALSEIASDQPRWEILRNATANAMVGRRGFESMAAVYERYDEALDEAFRREPMAVLQGATAARLQLEFGTVDPARACSEFNPNDWQGADKTVRMRMRLPSGSTRELTWTWEHGRWRIGDADFSRAQAPTPIAATTKPAARKGASASATRR